MDTSYCRTRPLKDLYVCAIARACVCRTSITRRVHGRFYGLDLKKEMVVVENLLDTPDFVMIKKMVADSKAKGTKPDLHTT